MEGRERRGERSDGSSEVSRGKEEEKGVSCHTHTTVFKIDPDNSFLGGRNMLSENSVDSLAKCT